MEPPFDPKDLTVNNQNNICVTFHKHQVAQEQTAGCSGQANLAFDCYLFKH